MRRMSFALVFLALTAPAFAQERTWMHQVYGVSDENGVKVADFVLISTVDSLQPSLMRYLYKDAAGRHLVIRSEDTQGGQASLSFECLATNEVLLLALEPNPDPEKSDIVTLGVAGQSFSFLDDDRTTPTVRNQAASLGVSTECAGALSEFTRVGVGHGVFLLVPALALHDILYYSHEKAPLPAGEKRIGAPSMNFDPSTSPPSDFEQEFGAAYYQ